MENQGNEICRARFSPNIILCIIKGILVFLIPFIVFVVINRSEMVGRKIPSRLEKTITIEKGIFTETISSPDDRFIPRELERYGYIVNGKKVEMYYFFGVHGLWAKRASILFIIGIAVLGAYVAFVHIIIASRCYLSMNGTQIEGQLKTLFGKKKLQMPIDHVDSVVTSSGFKDKLRGGETLIISANRGLIKFHYVRNADEFAQAAMKRIDEVKKTASHPASAPAPAQTTSGGDAMEKLNSLKQMLDSGLITQEDFDQKKADILSKM